MIVLVDYLFDPREREPEGLLARDPSLRPWAEAVAGASDEPVAVVRRFSRDGVLRCAGVDYHFVADGARGGVPPWHFGARLVAAVAARRPDVVHVDGLVYPIQLRHLRARLPPATALLAQDHGGLHAGSPGFRRPAWRAFYRLGLRAADGFLFTARADAAPWRQAGLIAPTQPVYEVLESSTDLGSLPPRPGDRRCAGQPALLSVARLDENKDPLTVLAAFAQVAARLPAAQLTMAFGSAALLPELRRRLDAAPVLRGRVHLLGRVDRAALPALYASADLFVQASHHESTGYALLEALAFGVTPAVSDIPAFRVLTGDGRVGALFPVGDVAALAAALERLAAITSPAQRTAIEAHFDRALSWRALGRRAAAVYREAAQRARWPRGRP